MAVDIKNYIIERIKAQDPEIDVREGSGVYDLLINPLTSILTAYQKDHSDIKNRQGITNIEELSESELDAVAANYLSTRNQGNLAQGYVKLYFRTPKAVSIPRGTKFSDESGLLEFETVNNYDISKYQMGKNLSDFPNYDTGPIFVQAIQAGAEYNVPAGMITNIKSGAVSPLKISNTEAFALGDDAETNTEFLSRLKNNLYNISLGSPNGLKTQIKEQKSSVVDVEVIGAGDKLMVRDLTKLTEDVESYVVEDFYLVASGERLPYHKKHRAYAGVFADTDLSSTVAIPPPSSWSAEFSDGMYHGLYFKDDDFYYAETEQSIMVRELFQDYTNPDLQLSMQDLLISGHWQLNDGTHPENGLWYQNEIQIRNVESDLQLGTYIDPDSEATDQAMIITLSQMTNIYNLVGSALVGTTDEAYQQLAELIDPISFNNLSPIFHKKIDRNLGIQIDLEMSTKDTSPDGSMCYITVMRDETKFAPHDGYGLAWRKQPDFLVRLNSGNGTAADETRFLEHYGIEFDYSAHVGKLHLESNKKFWKYNVYLVDNDILSEDVWVGHEQMWDQTSGKNQFLQAAKVWIEKDHTYEFRMKIYSSMAFEAWVYRKDAPVYGSDGTPYSPELKVINRGQTYPAYVPVAAGKHFGIGIGNTYNSTWYADNIEVKSFEESFPMHLFKVFCAPDKFPYAGGARIKYYGVGYDPQMYAAGGNLGHSSVKASVWNQTTSKWESLGGHQYTIDDPRYKHEISKTLQGPLSNYLDENNMISIAATATNSGPSFSEDTEHSLRSYYCSVDNLDVLGVHRGNAIDVYVHDPKSILTGSTTVTIPGPDLYTKNIPGISQYIQQIVGIEDSITGELIDPSLYTISLVKKGDSFSKNANYKISFDIDDITGAEVSLVYNFWGYGESLNAFLTQKSRHYPSQDLLLKVMPPSVVYITGLQYSGGLDVGPMKQMIVDWINSTTDTKLEKSDLINLLYDNGATYVDLNIGITVARYTTIYETFTTILAPSDSYYEIPNSSLSRFYTQVSNLGGIERV